MTSAEDVEKALATGKTGSAVLPHSAIKKIKEQFAQKGREGALAEMEEQAKAAGFESAEAMRAAAAEARANAGKKPPIVDRKAAEQLAAERSARVVAEQRAAEETRAREEAEAKAMKAEAEFHVREQVLQAHVKPGEVDYVTHRLRSALASVPDDQVGKFDEAKFFKDLRKEKPYLFMETTTPATTAPTGEKPPAPAPGAPKVDEQKVDTRTMTRQQYKEHMRRQGFRVT